MATKIKTVVKAQTYQGTGRRKTALARVRLVTGKGKFIINDRPIEEYFAGREPWEIMVKSPLEAAGLLGKFDVIVKAEGGGVSGQAGAVRHGIARALVKYDESLRAALRKDGHLTRDPRGKERKKYGRKRARRGFQWTKR
jgi:small subunit ribosomal protein S9